MALIFCLSKYNLFIQNVNIFNTLASQFVVWKKEAKG
jgi:hypothetical protein